MISSRPSDTSDIVFLVGAGVSIPIGIPAMRGIYNAFLDKAKSNITSTEKKTCEFFTKQLGVEKDLEDFLVAANAIAEFKTTSLSFLVEKAISSTRQSNSCLRGYRERLQKHIKDVSLVRTRILDFLSKTCFKFDRQEACDILGEFVDAISRKGYPVYSTNYDFALEHVAMERNITIEDNFRQSGQSWLWDRDIRFPLGDALTLIKLHGSVTWYADSDGVVEKIYNDTRINPIGRDINRLVIFPTRFKDIYDQHFFALYSHFLSALSDANILIILGHSLRDDYLRAGIIERFRKGNFQVIVVDPVFPKELPRELNPARPGSVGNVIHIPYKFEELSNDLAGMLIGSSPPEIAQKCADIVHHRRSKSNKITIKGMIGSLKGGHSKSFKAVVNAYLLPQDRPARIRAWLSATYRTGDGEEHNKVSSEFLEKGEILVSKDLSGMVTEEIPIEIDIPKIPLWAQHASKVKLRIGIVKSNTKKPSQIRGHVVAVDEREFAYSI